MPNPFSEGLAALISLGHAKSTRVFIDGVCAGWKRVFKYLISAVYSLVSHVLSMEARSPGQESKKADRRVCFRRRQILLIADGCRHQD